ncbi:hypothetical protein L6E12_24050 [Actinokineospora sp. PR83]|uniref:hypothetical protein n=1 Tax=Actinokineospora sp. PR83 TaxID=2884908 RepID=UPI001F3AD6EF|nr:hypothetical protein [Actinokineospora sp. PR83]MCG8918856.1 hypothetical protein [Actinokineospora sp. PR83]
MAEVEAAFAAGGVGRAMGVFAAAVGMAGNEPKPPDDPEAAAVVARFAADSAFFVGHEVPGFGTHETTLPSTPVLHLVGPSPRANRRTGPPAPSPPASAPRPPPSPVTTAVSAPTPPLSPPS